MTIPAPSSSSPLDAYWTIVEKTLNGRPISLGCAADLKEFIQEGICRLDDDQANDEVRNEAKAKVAEIVTLMISEADRLGLQELHENTFWNVRVSICPLYPFC